MYKFFLQFLLLNTLLIKASEQQANASPIAAVGSQFTRNFCIGAVSGTAGMAVYAPFHYAQNRVIQELAMLPNKTASTSLYGHTKQIMSGSRSLIFGKVPSIAIQQAGYAGIVQILAQNNIATSETNKFCANVLAAMLSAPIANASQLIALHQENQINKCNILKTIQSFPRGIKDLNRGLGLVTSREIIFMLLYNQVLPGIKNRIQRLTHSETSAYLISAPIAGALVAGCTQPINVCATYLHADIAQQKYSGGLFGLKQMLCNIKNKGVLAESFKGIHWRAPGVMLGLVAMNKTREAMSND